MVLQVKWQSHLGLKNCPILGGPVIAGPGAQANYATKFKFIMI